MLAPALTPSLTASLLLSLSSLQHSPKRFMARTLSAIQPQLRSFTAQDVARTLVAFARMHYTPHPEWLFEFTLEARRVLPRANKQQLLMIADSLAQLSNNSDVSVAPELLAAVLARVRVLLGAPGGAATAAVVAEALQPSLTAAAAGVTTAGNGSSNGGGSSSFSPADYANLAQSLVHLHVAPGQQLLAALCCSFVEVLPQATGTQVSTMLWALGAFWHSDAECLWLRQHSEVVRALVSAARPCLESYEPLQLKRVLVALATMGYTPGVEWLGAHEAAVLRQLQDMWPKSLEQILQGYRKLGYSSPGQVVLREALVAKQQEAQQQQQQQQQF